MKKVLIVQSNYIPWKGYFDAINLVDVFIIYDTAQYTIRDWRNRNKIKTKDGVKWLTIPVHGDRTKAIKDIKVADKNWAKLHWKTIHYNYARAKCYKEFKDIFEEAYHMAEKFEFLSEINYYFIRIICDILGIETEVKWSWEFDLRGLGRNEKLIYMVKEVGGTDYYTGPKAKNYIDEELFRKNGINIHYLDYSGYPEYPQLYPPFVHEVSIIDLILNVGKKAPKFMKSFKK